MITTDGPRGIERTLAAAVIDASGTWLTPNPIGADGVPAIGERHAGDRIEAGDPRRARPRPPPLRQPARRRRRLRPLGAERHP